jgi:hypothetical protein
MQSGQTGLFGPVADGSQQTQARVGKTMEIITGHAHARYYEAVSRGRCYYACNQSVVTFGTALTATAVTFTLSNPFGSGYNLSVLTTGLCIVTSTTAGSIVYAGNYNQNAAAVVHGTPLTVQNALLSGSSGVGKADAAATLPVAPTAFRTLAFGQVTALAVSGTIIDPVDGGIVVAPGTAVTLQGITIVGTGLFSMLWEEVPVS